MSKQNSFQKDERILHNITRKALFNNGVIEPLTQSQFESVKRVYTEYYNSKTHYPNKDGIKRMATKFGVFL